MSLVQALRTIDYFSAIRSYSSIRDEYKGRGMAIGGIVLDTSYDEMASLPVS